MISLWKALAVLPALVALSAAPEAVAGLPAGVHHQTIWVPDYYGRKVYRYVLDQTVSPSTYALKTLNVGGRNCNPNSVAVQEDHLYVVCNSDFGGLDQILVFDADTLAYLQRITGHGADGYKYFDGSSLVSIVFDKRKNLWVSGYLGNSLYRVPYRNLSNLSPTVDRQVVHSPDSPAGMTVSSDGAFWVVGQFSGGILLRFNDSVLNASGTFNHTAPLNPEPAACLSNDIDGCNPTPGLFAAPEGVAVFGGAVWVSNNGGNTPGKTLVRAVRHSDGTFTTALYGSVTSKPFACPGGLFAPVLAGATPQLWVNDEGYGQVGTDCGSSAAFQGSRVGRVFAFTSSDLLDHRTAPTPESFVGATYLKTGSPGFGGIFVRLD